ncbi:MAG: AI-2E family transporter [Armatimonadota bacterium]
MSEMSSGQSEEAVEGASGPEVRDCWPNRRIIFLAVVIALIFYAVFRLPPALSYVFERAREVVIMLVLSIALAYFLLPVVNALCRINVNLRPQVKRAIIAASVILLFLVLLVILVTVIIAPIVEETGQVLQTVTDWAQEDLAAQVEGFTSNLIDRLPEQYREPVREQITAAEQELTVERITETLSERVQDWGRTLLEWQVSIIATVMSSGRYIVALLIVPVFAYYFLTDATAIRDGIAAHIPEDARPRYHQMLTDMDVVIQRYVHTIMVISVMTGVATALTLYFAGVDVFLTFGILAGIANMIPVLGAIAAVIGITLISLLQVGLKTTIIVMIVYGAIQLVTDRIIAPKLMAEGAELHPIAVLVGLLVGAEFFGMIGVFVAVPVLAAGRVALIHYRAYVAEGEASREFDRLLGRDRPPCEETTEVDAELQSEAESVVGADDSEESAGDEEASDEEMNGDDVADECS